MIVLKTNYGDISIELDEKNTPLTAENFLKHAQAGFYHGTIFHRVIDGFMIQGGGFTPGMQAKPHADAIENEAPLAQANVRGSVAMARTNEPHSASTQFFINMVDNNFLNHTAKTSQGWGYCVFGHVVDGMDVVDQIGKVTTTRRAGHQDVPEEDVIINEVIIT